MTAGDPRLRLLVVPYDSGHLDARMGAGPLLLLPEAVRRLGNAGRTVSVHRIDAPSSWRAEAQTAFALQREVAHAVRESSRQGEASLLLAGNCNATLGVLAGLQSRSERVGLVWLDAHADFNTPETTATGFLDGQGLAMVAGRCWNRVTREVVGFTPLPEHDILLIGARDLGDPEQVALVDSEITWLSGARVRVAGTLDAALDALSGTVDVIHIHIDLDVLDPDAVAPANDYAAPDGLSARDVEQVVRSVANRAPVVSATLASFDPACDSEGQMYRTALDLIEVLSTVLLARRE